AQLNKAINDAVANEDVKARFKSLGVIAEGGAPQKVTDLIKQDVARWSVIIRDNNIRPE
ncbi:MAG: Tripartite-type tricarboxylate transporter, receptor component TctC, partial [Rhizobacter sp.]|nr:Tripartite-type tricarboxylate transporter, receptor component TctC [Rhizobacter sp.]